MINKYIIDANKKVTDWVDEEMPITYDQLQGGQSVTYRAAIGRGYYLDDIQVSTVKLYRRPRGDKLLSIKHLAKYANVGDFICFVYYRGLNIYGDEPYTTKWIDQDLVEVSECKRKDLNTFKGYIGVSILPSDHVELHIEDIYPSLKENVA
jgi:hypothetical protein